MRIKSKSAVMKQEKIMLQWSEFDIMLLDLKAEKIWTFERVMS